MKTVLATLVAAAMLCACGGGSDPETPQDSCDVPEGFVMILPDHCYPPPVVT